MYVNGVLVVCCCCIYLVLWFYVCGVFYKK